MKISFSGEEGIAATGSTVEEFLSNPEKIAACIPDSSDFQLLSESEFSIKVTVGVGGIHGTFAISGSVSKDSNGFVYNLKGSGFGNKVSISLTATPSQSNGSTKLLWKADFEISGIISGLGEGIIRKVSEEKIGIIIGNVKRALEQVT